MFAGVLIEDAVFLADAAASSSTLGSFVVCFSIGSSVLLLPCEFIFLWSILLRLQMGYRWDTVLLHYLYQLVCFRVWFLFMFRPLTLYLSRVTFLVDFISCGAMSHRVLTSWVVCDMLHLWFRLVFAT